MTAELIDLTVPCSNDTDGFTITTPADLPVYLGQTCMAFDLSIQSHRGTYFETSSHVFRDGKDTDSVALDDFVLPGVCVRPQTDRRCITADDLDNACETIDPGCGLLIDTGKPTEEFKYFSRDAAGWMADHDVKLMGANTPRYDSGFENPTGFFIDLFQAEIPIIANLVNVDRLPERGFTLIVLPLRIAGVCTVPCRVIAAIGATL